MADVEFIADLLTRNLEMLKWMLGDFTDADMLVRPTPTANHAAWQIGHLAGAESHMLQEIRPGAVPPPPPEFASKFTKENSKLDDPKAFASKNEILEQMTKVRNATIALVKSLKNEDLKIPTTGRMKDFCPTHGHLIQMQESHITMHIGQIQVIRRKLGKPVLF
jgi:hypothetical protein